MTKNVSSNSHLWKVGDNVKMLCEQIEKEKGKITSERLLSADEGTEISFWTLAKMRGLELTDIQIFVATQRLGRTLFGRGNDTPTSEGGEGTSYSGSGIGKIQDGQARGYILSDERAYAEVALIRCLLYLAQRNLRQLRRPVGTVLPPDGESGGQHLKMAHKGFQIN